MAEGIRFGATISTSGRYALQGRQALAGLHAWVEGVNQEGGTKLGRDGTRIPVELLYYDDASSPGRAGENAERLIGQDEVHALIGPYSSDLTRAVLPVARRHGKVLWNHGGASDDLYPPGGRAVGILTPVSRYFTGVIDLAHTLDPDACRLVLVCRKGSGFGRHAARGVRRAAGAAGFTTHVVTYSSLAAELPRVLATLQKLQPDLLLSTGSFHEEVALAQGLIAHGLGANTVGLTAAAMEEFGRALGRHAEGFLGPSQWDPGIRYTPDFGPSPAEVARRIRAKGEAADYPGAQAYAACLIAQRCLEEEGIRSDEAVFRTACSLDCTTFFGRFRIDPGTGVQVGHEMVCVQWQGHKKMIVWPPGSAQVKPFRA